MWCWHMAKIADKIKRVEETVASACARSGRKPSDLKLVIVTKSADIEEIKEVVQLGYNHLGENRVQQLKKVAAQVAEFTGRQAADSHLPRYR